MTIQEHLFEDSRGEKIKVTVSGPYGSGSATPGEDITKRPRKWMARFARSGREGEINVELYTAGMSVDELREVLERQPEWIHDDWSS